MSNRVWLVTGASRGIGAEIAKTVLASGDKLVATARTADSLTHLGTHESLLCFPLDVTSEQQAADAVNAALARFGHIDILVNNAGVCVLGAVEETSVEQVDLLYRTNVFGLLNVTRAVLPAYAETPRRAHHQHIFSCGLQRLRRVWRIFVNKIRGGGFIGGPSRRTGTFERSCHDC